MSIGLAFSRFEGLEDRPANVGGIFDGLQPRREWLPFVVAEIMKSRTAGDDQCIITDFSIGQDELPIGQVKSITSASKTEHFSGFAGSHAAEKRCLRPTAIQSLLDRVRAETDESCGGPGG
jgi:hypothetical protein